VHARRLAWIATLLAAATGAAAEPPPEEAEGERFWNLGATLEVEYAPNTQDFSTQKAEILFEPRLEASLPGELSLTALARLYSEVAGNLEPGSQNLTSYAAATVPLALGDRTELSLREFFLDRTLGPAFVRVGKQQIVWGEADGLKVLDLVDPQSFMEFILDDFDDSRIPLWSLDVEVPVRSSLFQLVWVPDPTFHRVPGVETLGPAPLDAYAPTARQFRQEVPIEFGEDVDFVVLDPGHPSWDPTNWDVGGRFSTVFHGWELSVNAIYQLDDFPVFDYVDQRLVTVPPRVLLQVDAVERHERQTVVGGTFNRPIGDFVIRGEFGYFIDRAFTAKYEFLPEGIPQILHSDQIQYVIGLDWFGLKNTFVSAQVFQRFTLDYRRQMVSDRHATTVTFAAQRTFLNERLALEVIWLHGIDYVDGLVRPKVTFELFDVLDLWIGADVFYGGRNGVFGQFVDNTRLAFGFKAGI
jgi:hypothetical protein